MRLDDDQPTAKTFSVIGQNYMSGVGGWLKRWRLWENCGPRENPAVGECDMPCVRCVEEVDYQRRVIQYTRDAKQGRYQSLFLDHVQFQNLTIRISPSPPTTILTHTWTPRHDSALTEAWVWRWPVGIIWRRSRLPPLCVPRNNLEAFSFTASMCPSMCPCYYVPLPPWWYMYEACPYLFVSTTPVLYYHSQEMLKETDSKTLFMPIYLSELIVLSLI